MFGLGRVEDQLERMREEARVNDDGGRRVRFEHRGKERRRCEGKRRNALRCEGEVGDEELCRQRRSAREVIQRYSLDARTFQLRHFAPREATWPSQMTSRQSETAYSRTSKMRRTGSGRLTETVIEQQENV